MLCRSVPLGGRHRRRRQAQELLGGVPRRLLDLLDAGLDVRDPLFLLGELGDDLEGHRGLLLEELDRGLRRGRDRGCDRDFGRDRPFDAVGAGLPDLRGHLGEPAPEFLGDGLVAPHGQDVEALLGNR